MLSKYLIKLCGLLNSLQSLIGSRDPEFTTIIYGHTQCVLAILSIWFAVSDA